MPTKRRQRFLSRSERAKAHWETVEASGLQQVLRQLLLKGLRQGVSATVRCDGVYL